MTDMEEVRAFLDERCRCTGKAEDWLQASEIVAAFQDWRMDRRLPPWTSRTAAWRLRDGIEHWRDRLTGIRPHRHKSSCIRYLGLTWLSV